MNMSALRTSTKLIETLGPVVVRFAGAHLTNTSALAGGDVATFPDFPAETPRTEGDAGRGVVQVVHFASRDI